MAKVLNSCVPVQFIMCCDNLNILLHNTVPMFVLYCLYTFVTTDLLYLWSFNWGCLHCFPPRGPVSTTSFGGGGGGGSYKTTAFIHGAFNSELGVDKSEGAGMCSLR